MTCYRRLPTSYWCEDLSEEIPDALRPSLTVYETEDVTPTGVYDAQGHELGRVRERVGFRFK